MVEHTFRCTGAPEGCSVRNVYSKVLPHFRTRLQGAGCLKALSPRPAPSAKDEMDGNSAICRAESFLEIEAKLVFELGIG